MANNYYTCTISVYVINKVTLTKTNKDFSPNILLRGLFKKLALYIHNLRVEIYYTYKIGI